MMINQEKQQYTKFQKSTLNSQIFRAYDIRGVVPDDFDEEGAYRIGQVFGSLVHQAGGQTIVLGYDGRLTSLGLSKALSQGLQDAGLDIINVGLGPTPLVYFAHYYLETDAAIMVTGSHNPPHHNGFKMVLQRKPFFGTQIDALRDRLFESKITLNETSVTKGLVRSQLVAEPYLNYLIQSFTDSLTSINSRPLRVVWDAGHGATADLLTDLVRRLPGEHLLLNATIDGTFPAHHPDPAVAANLIQLQQAVVDSKADIGFAFDGDGDRLGVIDDQGNILWGDQLVMFLAEEILKTHPGATIIADIKASQLFIDHIKKWGGVPLLCRSGHSLIKSKMAETQSPLAGEMSGHLFFADRHYGYDDGLYGAVRLLALCACRSTPLSIWYNQLPKLWTTPEIRIDCTQIDRFALIDQLQHRLRQDQTAVDTTDGVRVANEEGWWLVRASNTANEMTLRIEGRSQTSLKRLKKTLEKYLTIYPIDLKDLNL